MSFFNKQRENIKEYILATAIDLYRKNGYEKTTISEITKAVGIAKGTFYNYYQSKLEILLIWSKSVFESIDLNSSLNQEKDFRINVYHFIDSLTDKIREDETLYLAFLQEILKLQNDKALKKDFNMNQLIQFIMLKSKDKTQLIDDIDLKVNILNNSLFLEMIHWFSVNHTSDGLDVQLKKIINICLDGMYR